MTPTRRSLASGTLSTTKGPLYQSPFGNTSEVTSISITHINPAGADSTVTISKRNGVTNVEVPINGQDIIYGPGYFSEDDKTLVMNGGDVILGVTDSEGVMQYNIEGFEYQNDQR